MQESNDRSPNSTEIENALAQLQKPTMVEYDQIQNPELYTSGPLGCLKFLLDSNAMS